MKRLENKIAIVTGGAQGIGKATVEKFLIEGATVLIWDVDDTKGNKFVNDLSAQGFKTKFMKVNVAKFDEVDKAINDIINLYGRVDILCK